MAVQHKSKSAFFHWTSCLYWLMHPVGPFVGPNRQEDYCLVGESLAKAELAIGYSPALLTDDEDNAEVAAYAGAATTSQVQLATGIAKQLGVLVGIGQNPLHLALDSLTHAAVA